VSNGGGGFVTCAISTADASSASNGKIPASDKYATTPSE
jgi:hypothetical protein